ncbi:MAG TPA: ABC transporter substrate-binding protein [Candidatus Acidoferrales bacterium]|jgi:iron complex transport system substrate-binding protein|nr:ABC transporter substrate-binding protein [Candidatus Acidoferrales bacterium]
MAQVNQNGRRRIVSLAPSATSILVALGARRELVGVTKWCAEVAAVGGLPRLGDCWSLDPERVVKLRPTLVIGSVPYKQQTVAKLLENPLTFLAMNPRTLADIEADILLLGRIVQRESAAGRLVAGMRKAFADLRDKGRKTENPRGQGKRIPVYCEAWPRPRISSPPWVAELVEIAGGRMVVRPGARISDAEVARARPEVMIIAWAATGTRGRASTALANPAWQGVPAVRDRRVYVVRDAILNTPGPPLVEGARELFRILHSETT